MVWDMESLSSVKCYYTIEQEVGPNLYQVIGIVTDEDVAKHFCSTHSGCKYFLKEIVYYN